MNYKVYEVTIEMDISIKDDGLVQQNPDSVAAAVRHMLRTLLPHGWRKNGVLFNITTIGTVARDKLQEPAEGANNE